MTILNEFHRDEGRVLDRLIDGELGAQERRQLLAALDDEPGAWRRCALAFLEAQSWRWQLSRLAAEPLVAQAVAQPAPHLPRAKRAQAWLGWFAVAASVVVAFALGRGFPTDSTLIAQHVMEPPGQLAEQAIAADQLDDLAFDDQPSEWETLTLSAGDAEAAEPIELLVSNSLEDEQDLDLDDQSAISARLLSQMELAGWEIKHQQRLLPVNLSDGRRLVVPVEELDLRHPEQAYY